MNTTENQNDPYAHLKQAWEDGRRIRYKTVDGGWSPWVQKGSGIVLSWVNAPSGYEIEPLPADKWAKEKTAHAQGKGIEYKMLGGYWMEATRPSWSNDGTVEFRIAPDLAPTYHTTAVVEQRREEAAAINASMNPAPAGKLSDEELGEIGAKAGVQWYNKHGPHGQTLLYLAEDGTGGYAKDADPRTAIARAVREAVEKEQAEEIAQLTAELSTVNAERAETRVIRSEMIKAQAELAKANAELERLRWRPVSVKPTEADADTYLQVVVSYVGREMEWGGFYAIETWPWAGDDVACWRPFCPPPAPTAEEVERERFEKACAQYGLSFTRDEGGNYRDSRTLVLFDVWQAARAAKEGEKV